MECNRSLENQFESHNEQHHHSHHHHHLHQHHHHHQQHAMATTDHSSSNKTNMDNENASQIALRKQFVAHYSHDKKFDNYANDLLNFEK